MIETADAWYDVNDPAVIKKRVLLMNKMPIGLMVLAKRFQKTTIFSYTPQQSDYVAIWDKIETVTNIKKPSFSKRLRIKIKKSLSLKTILHFVFYWIPLILKLLGPFGYNRIRRKQSLKNKELYKRVK